MSPNDAAVVSAISSAVAAVVALVTVVKALARERRTSRRAQISLAFVPTGSDRVLMVANDGQAEARNVEVDLIEPPAKPDGRSPMLTLERELPLERLSPGSRYYIGWRHLPGSTTRYRVRVTWDDDDTDGHEAVYPLSVHLPRPPEPPARIVPLI